MSEDKQVLSGISNALGLPPLILDQEEPQQQELVPVDPGLSKEDQETEIDFEFARENTKDLLTKGRDALDSLLRVANASENPRAFEVVATLIKNLGEVNARLMELHEQRRQIVPPVVEPEAAAEAKPRDGAFVGTTEELLQLIERGRKERAKQKEPTPDGEAKEPNIPAE